MEMNIETISAIALGIGLSASTGFRVFIPLLVAGIASRIGLIPWVKVLHGWDPCLQSSVSV